MKLCKLKCDRCDNEYEENKKDDVIEIVFKEQLNPGYFYYDFDYKGEDQDLCSSCRDSFKKWWKMK